MQINRTVGNMVGKLNHKAEESKDYLTHLKENNLALAKDLSKEKILSKQYLSEKMWLQQKLQQANLLNMRYQTLLKQLMVQAKHTLPSCIALSDTIGQLIKSCSDGVNYTAQLNADTIKNSGKLSLCSNLRPVSPGVPNNKTRAVQPMVSGHVIFRPTINLRRLNGTEHSLAESLSSNENLPRIGESTMVETERLLESNVEDNLFLGNYQPFRTFQLSNALENLETNDDELNEVPEDNNEIIASNRNEPQTLPMVLEDSSESIDDGSVTIDVLRQVSVVLHPIPIENSPEISIARSCDISSVISNYDPMEGPSNLLDDRGFVRRGNNTSKRKFENFEDSSESSDSGEKTPKAKTKRQNKKKLLNSKVNLNNRKAATAVNYIETDEAENLQVVRKTVRKKSKKHKENHEVEFDLSEPVVVLTKLPNNFESPQSNDNISNSEHSTSSKKNSDSDHYQSIKSRKSSSGSNSDIRPRRSRPICSYKEISLNSKLRREK